MAAALEIVGTDEALGFLEEVAGEMVLLFPITMDEAIGRINRALRGRQFTSDLEVNVLLHEEQDVWARHIYYGRDSAWWVDGASPEPLPYP